jgi:hypothetical protein
MGESWSREEGWGCRRHEGPGWGSSTTASIVLRSQIGCPVAGVVEDPGSQGRSREVSAIFYLSAISFSVCRCKGTESESETVLAAYETFGLRVRTVGRGPWVDLFSAIYKRKKKPLFSNFFLFDGYEGFFCEK